MSTRIKLPPETLIVVDRTTRGNINPDMDRNDTPETVKHALTRGAFDTVLGTMQFSVRLFDPVATAAAMGFARVALAGGGDSRAVYVEAYTQFDVDLETQSQQIMDELLVRRLQNR